MDKREEAESSKLKAEKKRGTRNALLAQVHIAKKDVGMSDDDYRDILHAEFGVHSAADLTVRELGRMVARFEQKGWRASRTRTTDTNHDQCRALKERIGQMLLPTDFDETRLRGLVRRICAVEDLRWCTDVVRLKALLAAIGSMMDRGDIKVAVGDRSGAAPL